MNPVGKLVGFIVMLAVVLTVAIGVGNAVGPIGPTSDHESTHITDPNPGSSH
ncbi:hypothetical protein KUV85_07070 [Nocardioides panacisoli]|uniref:hypothetical protein n=1 Tax=Nocardioides panacisoli TaxID=627624 RepID=UPI001C6328AA|nr:hypothetical protein [Nocardioides panacisoli]QYJ05435.1 hypothetical protein KUV85_07070 [Nocardioides panacisoli]